ncbi:MAG: mandelate racemase/muconate lactonizing enzyme family protein [Casimicrobiaceae bacterium]
MMKIARAESILLSLPFGAGGTPPWSFGGKPANAFDVLLVRLETDSGLVGWGEAFSRGQDIALKQLIDTRVLPLIVGRDASQISKIKHDLEFQLHNFGRNGSIQYGIAAVDIALWDLLGKASGQPLSRLLGGAYTDEVEAYASLMRYGNVHDVKEATRHAIERGYRYIKLHEIGLEEIRAAVEAAGSTAKVMLDTNCPWTVAEALAMSRELQDLNLHWLEEPVWPPENFRGLAILRKQDLHRIAAGENTGSLHDFMAMIDAGAIDIAQPDVAKTGGVTEVLKIAALCEAHGIEFSPHCALFGPGQVATLHLTAAHRSTPLFERLYCDFETELYGEATIPKLGKIKVPQGPGLGLDPDPAVLDKFRVQ